MIDTHVHVWDLDRADYSWLGPQHGAINRTIDFAEVIPAMRDAGVHRAILVQAADNAEDTGHMLEVARDNAEIAGVVGFVPLHRPADAQSALDRLRMESVFVGVRNLIHDRPDPDWIVRPDVDRGLGMLEAAGIPFDLVAVLPRHLEHVPTLCDRHPGLRIVIDHLAKPPMKAPDEGQWMTLLAEAARRPNVYAKISGLYPARGEVHDWTPDDLRPFVDHALETFGSRRLMFGSDWPICVAAGGYMRVHRAITTCLDRLSATEQAAIYTNTAAEFYGIAR